jgi:hypothetical protein
MALIVSGMSVATMLVSGWMTLMYFVLRHPGYLWRATIAAVVCTGAFSLLAGRPPAALRLPIAVWGAALAAFGIWTLVEPGDDGWVLIAGSLFIVEGMLAVAASVRPRTA